MYNTTFKNTLLPIGQSRYIDDLYGSTCWKYVSEKVTFTSTISKFRLQDNERYTILIEYYESDTGYLRLCYDNNRVKTDVTLRETIGRNKWILTKYTFDGRLMEIFEPGSFQLYMCDDEGTIANQNCIIRLVALEHIQSRTLLNWQSLGITPATRETLSIEYIRIPVVGDPERMIRLIDPEDINGNHYGMRVISSLLPLYFSVAEGDSIFWRNASGRPITFEIQYFDNGTDDILVTYMSPSGLQSDIKIVTRKGHNEWKTASIILDIDPSKTTLYIQSNTVTQADPIVDSGPLGLTIQNSDSNNLYHDSTEKQVGASSLQFVTGLEELTAVADNASRFDIGSGEFTMQYWLKQTTSGCRVRLGVGYDPQTWPGWWVDHNGWSSANWVGVDGTWWGSDVGAGDSNWHHYTWVCDGSTMAAWRDGGVEHATRGYSSIQALTDQDFFVSDMGGNAQFYLDELHVEMGYARYDVNDSTISYPLGLISEDGNYNIEDTDKKLLNNGSINDADVKLSSSGESPIYLSRIVITDDNNAVITWKP